MSEDFKKKKCGPLFDDWKKCFTAEVGFVNVSSTISKRIMNGREVLNLRRLQLPQFFPILTFTFSLWQVKQALEGATPGKKIPCTQ